MERIQKYLNRIYRAAVLDRTAAFAARGLPGWQVSYILQICRTPGLSQDELAARLLVNKSSVTRQVAQMQQNGLVLRETDPSDRRIKRLHPTEKAQALYPEIMSYLEEWNDVLTGDLSPQDQADLLRLLNHLAKAATLRLRSQDLDTLLNDDLPTDRPETDRPATDQPATDQPATDQLATDRPATERPAADRPATDQPEST